MLFLYVRLLISSEKTRLRRPDLLHFIPFALFYCLFLTVSHPKPMLPQPDRVNSVVGPIAENGIGTLFEPLLTHFGFINILFFFGYSVVTIYLLNNHQKKIATIFSRRDNLISLKWIYALPSSVAILVVANVTYESFGEAHITIEPLARHMFSFFCFIVLLCFFGIKQKPVFQFKRPHSENKQNAIQAPCLASDNIAEPLENVSNDPVSAEFIAQKIEELESYMQREKPYVNPDFSVYMLSDALNIPRRTLSLVLNTGLSKNFYQYVNQFRIEEVKYQLGCPNNTSTILDIAFQAGFKSKSSFNSLFKQHCNVTPSQYRKASKQQDRDASTNNS